MRSPRALPLAVLALLLGAPAASASFPHTVVPGESLSSVAAANGMSVGTIAAANGLSPDAQLVTGSVVQIPPAGAAPASSTAVTTPVASSPSTATSASGGHLVQPGETLTGVAAANGLSVASLAAANGLSPTSFLIAGTHLRIAGSAAAATPVAAAPAATSTASSAPAPASSGSGTVTSSDIAAVASRNGVPSSLASAIAWQESGFNNRMVSSVGARGVMQVMPGTFDWVQRNLAARQLSSANSEDNIGAGVLYLGHLLKETGGDEASAIAGYYQGLASVRARGMYDDTKQYVDNVMALRSRFGG